MSLGLLYHDIRLDNNTDQVHLDNSVVEVRPNYMNENCRENVHVHMVDTDITMVVLAKLIMI